MQTARPSQQTLKALLGIEFPVIQAPMAGVQDVELPAAVSNAGGLGSLPCAMLTPVALESALQRLTALTDKPFNVNFFCHKTPTVTPDQAQNWYQHLSQYFVELGVEPPDGKQTAFREPFGEAALSVLEQFRPAVVSFHFGLPDGAQLEQIKRWGTRVIASATTLEGPDPSLSLAGSRPEWPAPRPRGTEHSWADGQSVFAGPAEMAKAIPPFRKKPSGAQPFSRDGDRPPHGWAPLSAARRTSECSSCCAAKTNGWTRKQMRVLEQK